MYIAAVTKVRNQYSVSQFRSISLRNFVYKTIFKVMVNHLKLLNQATFILHQAIQDNISIAHKSFYSLKTCRRYKNHKTAIRLDMPKTYERVEWPFLESILMKLDFSSYFFYLIMQCVTIISYSVLINGSPSIPFYPSRGLRERNPLSPYLFLLVSKGLSCLLNYAQMLDALKKFQITRHYLTISSVLFANGMLLFGRDHKLEVATFLLNLNCNRRVSHFKNLSFLLFLLEGLMGIELHNRDFILS